MRIEWRPEARADLKQIISYVADRNLQAAVELNQAIHAARPLFRNILTSTGQVESGAREKSSRMPTICWFIR